MDNWKNIWDKRQDNLAAIDLSDKKAVFSELKRVDGFDLEGGLPVESLLNQYENTKRELGVVAGDSVFEVGSGAGANLYLFAQDGFTVGALDYAENLLAVLRRVIPPTALRECVRDEGKNLPTDVKYDAVFANGVFIYFDGLAYAHEVLVKMLTKTRRSLGMLDVYDAAKREACIAHRRATIPDYDERYKDLPKMFYPREFFTDFAAANRLDVWFTDNELTDYGNAPYTYHCFMRRKG